MAKPSEAMWRAVNNSSRVQNQLKKVAERTAARATQISREAGGTANYTVRSGIRPGGRAYFDVVSDNEAEERGTEDVPRINALRRAARGE